MSGYGGHPPAASEEPHGNRTPHDPGYGYGPPGVPPRTVSPEVIRAALVCNSIAIVLTCNVFAIAGVITALKAQQRVNTNPGSARKLTIWSWTLFATTLVIGVAIIALYFLFGLSYVTPGRV